MSRRIAPVALLLLGVVACGDSDPTGQPDGGSSGQPTVVLSTASLDLTFLGETSDVSATVRSADGSVQNTPVAWVSDDAGTATVDGNGRVTAVANGTTTIRATAGGATAALTVVVQQAPSDLVVLSGGGQAAPAGTTLPDPVRVQAFDQGGTPVMGVALTFAAETGGGSVSPTSAIGDADGIAQTSWTLGTTPGDQTLVVATNTPTGPRLSASATAESATPLPDLVATVLVLSRDDPSSLEVIQATTTIRNDGSVGTGESFQARLFVDDVERAALQVAAVAAGTSETITFDVGLLVSGPRSLRLEIDLDGAIEEVNEANNTVLRNVTVVEQRPVQAATPVAGLAGPAAAELLFRFDLPAGSQGALTFELTGGSGDVDLFVEQGVRPSARAQYDDCLSGGPTAEERCSLNDPEAGPYHILVHGFEAFTGTTLQVTTGGAVVPYDIEVVFIDRGTPEQDAVVEAAAARWMELITSDIGDIDFSADPVLADECIEGQPVVDDVVDDLRIFVKIVEIDGIGRTLARAGPCVTRGLTDLPAVGTMEFDAADLDALLAAGEMLPIVLHEMGHVLGIGTIWDRRGLLRNPSLPSNTGADTHFTGPLAIAAFDEAGGSSYTGGAKIPVENQAGEGSSDAHWRETPLGRELMTPFFNSGQSNPLSAISVQSLADLGYVVDPTRADSYSGSFSAPGRGGFSGPILDLRGDTWLGADIVVDPNGRLTRRKRR